MQRCARAARMLAALLAVATGVAAAQDYPSKPIRIIGAASGGNSDVLSRFIRLDAAGYRSHREAREDGGIDCRMKKHYPHPNLWGFSRKRIDDAVRW